MPTPSRLKVQERLAHDLDGAEERVNHLSAALDKQIALLQEHRDAVITAAVAGQLDLPEAA